MLISSSFLVITLWLTCTQAGFRNPDFLSPYGPGPHERNDVWTVGDVHLVRCETADITDFSNYTVALWQQSLSEDNPGATLGPVVYGTLASPCHSLKTFT